MKKRKLTVLLVSIFLLTTFVANGWAQMLLHKNRPSTVHRPKPTVRKAVPTISISKRKIGGVAILKPKANQVIAAAGDYTIKYMAPDATVVNIYMIIPQPGNKQATRYILKNGAPTGSVTKTFTESLAPFTKQGAGPIGGSIKYHDGTVQLKLVATINGKDVIHTIPVKIKVPRLRLLNPKVDQNIYRGLWHEGRWSSIGKRMPTVKVSVMYHSGATIMGEKIVWSKEVPNNGKYRFRLPRELAKPKAGHISYFQVEEVFPVHVWSARVREVHRIKIH